jgi:hypothetical protein
MTRSNARDRWSLGCAILHRMGFATERAGWARRLASSATLSNTCSFGRAQSTSSGLDAWEVVAAASLRLLEVDVEDEPWLGTGSLPSAYSSGDPFATVVQR